jgi:hypothetical protein
MEISLSDKAMEIFRQVKSGPSAELAEDEQPFSVAMKEAWEAMEKKDLKAFREAFKNAITIGVNER